MVEAVTQGDVDTAKRLLRVAESGKQLFMFVLTATCTTLLILYSIVLVGTVQMGTVQGMQLFTVTTLTLTLGWSGRLRNVLTLHCQVGSRSSLYAECAVAKESDARLLSLVVYVIA